MLLKEYLLSGDVLEAERCLQELEVPHFHHELVYEVSRNLSPFSNCHNTNKFGLVLMCARKCSDVIWITKVFHVKLMACVQTVRVSCC